MTPETTLVVGIIFSIIIVFTCWCGLLFIFAGRMNHEELP